MATNNQSHISVIEGYHASLQEAGLPLSVCIQLQECKLSLHYGQLTTRRKSSGFSMTLFCPEQLDALKLWFSWQRSVERGISSKWRRLRYHKVPVVPVLSRSYLGQRRRLQHWALLQMHGAHTPRLPPPSQCIAYNQRQVEFFFNASIAELMLAVNSGFDNVLLFFSYFYETLYAWCKGRMNSESTLMWYMHP